MRTNFLKGIIVTALIATSCSKDEVSSIYNHDDNVIGFEVSTGKTRAGVATVSAITGSTRGIGIFAFNGDKSFIIDHEAYVYDAGRWKWSNEGQDFTYWPEEDDDYPINFYAYFPNTLDRKIDDKLESEYVIESTPKEQKDYLAARSINVAQKPTLGYVPLPFKHILSKIDFKIVTGAEVTVFVQSIAVRNVGEEGTFNYSVMNWNAKPAGYEYLSGYNFMTAADPMNVFEAQISSEWIEGSSGSLMLMPQDLSKRGWDKDHKDAIENLKDESYIEVVYRVHLNDVKKTDIVGFTDATNYPKYDDLPYDRKVTGALFVKVGYPLPTHWEMGKSYAYTVYIADGESSGGNLIEGNFIDENGNTTTLPVVDPQTGVPIVPPGPIFPDSEVIGFTITVGAWDAQDDIPLQ